MLVSLALAALAASLVFGLWYPGAYSQLAGGRELFLLLISVDLILGPLLTFAVFNIAKGWSHLRRDLSMIGLIQAAALGYGLHTVFVVRPVVMVLEGKRFRLVSAKDVAMSELPAARPEYRRLPVTGPWLLGTRAPRSEKENSEALFMAVGGVDVGQRPSFWQSYSESTAEALAVSRPLDLLFAHNPERSEDLKLALQAMKVEASSARFVPVIARGNWSAIVDPTGHPVGYLPVNGFF